MAGLEKNYQDILKQLVERIRQSRQNVARVANSELLTTYWEIGRTILEQKAKEGWGKKTIERLAKDLKAEFPNSGGFSDRNLVYMQTFASAWPFFPFTQPPVAELPSPSSLEDTLTPSVAAKTQASGRSPILAQVPWTHHTVILDKVKDENERIFYIKKVIENSRTKNILKVNIETNLYNRQGGAITNFHKWKDDELNYVAEQWSEQIVDEISRKAESVL